MEETGVPGKKHPLTPSHWQLSHLTERYSKWGSGERWQATQPSGLALNGERQLPFSDSVLDHMAIRAGPQWLETASSQWQRLRPHGHHGRPSVMRDSKQSVATP